MPTAGDDDYRERFIHGEAPQRDYQEALAVFSLDDALGCAVDAWIARKDAVACGAMQTAQDHWRRRYLTSTLQEVARMREEHPDGHFWPFDGCPEADEATGWEGWYGDYPH